MTGMGLKLTDQKIDVLLISSRKKMKFTTINIGDQRIISKRAIKLVGVMIDNRPTFREHIARKAIKKRNRHIWSPIVKITR